MVDRILQRTGYAHFAARSEISTTSFSNRGNLNTRLLQLRRPIGKKSLTVSTTKLKLI